MSRQLPPLNALRVFEITARAGSYTEAAKELHLTHGAISRQIQLLEQALGQPLFYKVGQRMVATDHAKAFAKEISAAFESISDASRRYGKSASSKVIRISAPATFAMRWLIPKLDDFKSRYPAIELRISTVRSDDPEQRGRFDVSIRRAPADEAHFEISDLFTETSTVIVSPKLLAARPVKDPSELESVVLLSTESRPRDWEDWFDAAGHPDLRPKKIIRFDHYYVTLQAAVDGMGFAVGSFPTLQADIDFGRLVTPFPGWHVSGHSYYVVVPLDTDKPVYLRDFLDWLHSQKNSLQPSMNSPKDSPEP